MSRNPSRCALFFALLSLACQGKPAAPAPSPAPTPAKPSTLQAAPAPTPASTPAAASAPAPVKKDFDPRAALHALYGGDATKETATWKPNKAELRAAISDPEEAIGVDSLPEEMIVRVAKHKTFSLGGKDYALLIVESFDEGDEDSHAEGHAYGGALYVQEAGEWKELSKRLHITNAGSWGEGGTVSFVQIGPERYGVEIGSGFSGQGYTTENDSLYDSFAGFASIFSHESSADNGGACEGADCFSVKRSRSYLPGPNPTFYDLEVKSSGTEENDAGKVVPATKTERFRHDGTSYQLVK
jgi:hypothetical protein